ncbi:hypothetical protein DFH11DRAFT_1563712 [Phellopilus nigrolimitatus]|nr:hypothetical protein DFH11DRAFT_1563712 [Phellopilus nigrolimitatus]
MSALEDGNRRSRDSASEHGSKTARAPPSASSDSGRTEPETQPPPPHAARFWDRDPVTAAKRRIYFKTMFGGTFLTTLMIFGVLSIFWGSLWKTDSYTHNLNGWIVDFDGGPIGQTVTQAFLNATGRPEQMSWKAVDASQFANGVDDVAQAVVDEKAWVAVTVNPGASNNLSAAIASADASYNGSLAVTAYAAEARNENGYMIIVPVMEVPLVAAAKAFALLNSRQIASNSSTNFQQLLLQAPSIVTQPVYYTIANIRPFDVPVATAMMSYQARVIISGLNRHLCLRSLLMLRVIAPIFAYFVISLFFSLLSLAFQAPFRRVFGGWGFVIYWMMNWMGMCALGLALESFITVLTPAFTPFFLVLWIISNVSIASVPIEVLPGVFRYGYATPFYNISRTVRTILFNTRNQVGLNFGVQIAWIAISLITMLLFTVLLRQKEQRELRRQQASSSEKKP